MKKIHFFHIGMIAFIVFGFTVANQGELTEAGIVIDFFLGMLTIAYVAATVADLVVPDEPKG